MFDTEKFIRSIERNPSIWDIGSKCYMDRHMKQESWHGVGNVMYEYWNFLGEHEKEDKVREMKKKWRHIRDSHVKYMQQTKNGHVKKKKYVYADELEFLEMGIKNRLLNGNINNNINVDNEWHELSGDGNDQEEELGGGQEENFTVKIENPISAVEVFLAEEDIKQDYSEVMDSIETELPTREISGVRSVKNFNPDDLPPSPRAKRPRLQELSDTMKQLKQMNESGLCGHDDNECDIFGRYVSAQLKKMSTEQCILSQEQIQAILTRSRLNDLRNQFSS